MFNLFKRKPNSPPKEDPIPESDPKPVSKDMIRQILMPVASRSPDSGIPPLCRSLKGQHVVIIATWDSPESTKIDIQDFYRGEQRFIPFFLDESDFKAQSAGSEFSNKGKSIAFDFLLSLLPRDTLLVLNPGGSCPVDLTPQEYFSAIEGWNRQQ